MPASLDFDSLNPHQKLAVTTTEGPVLVLAGPGSGKTRVLTHRIGYLIQEIGIPDNSIVAVTFTNKAAKEMKERTETLMGRKLQGTILGTFHAFCAQILRQSAHLTPYKSNFTIYDTADQKSLLRQILGDMWNAPATKKEANPKVNQALGIISRAKNELISPENFVPEQPKEVWVKRIYDLYMRRLQENNALDFDDLLMQTVMLFDRHPERLAQYQERFQYLMVDEFQDTNTAQYKLIWQLTYPTPGQNIFLVGDPDQSIYAFRGADYRNIDRFRRDYPQHQVITLDENYRSHQIILDAAMGVIRRNQTHIRRDLFSQRKRGAKVIVYGAETDFSEARFIASTLSDLRREEGYGLRDFAMMYRTNAQSRNLENILREYAIPYRVVGGLRFYERREIKDLLAYLHVINNPNDTQRLLRIINMPARGFGEKSQYRFFNWVGERQTGAWQALLDVRDGKQHPLGRVPKPLVQFVNLLEKWRGIAQTDETNLAGLFDSILQDTNYETYMQTYCEDLNDFNSRKENLAELKRELTTAGGMTLANYLIQNALLTDIDNTDPDEESVTLMTLHAAKGLEFPVVFIVGVENGLLPHNRSIDNPQEVEEERRLFYVGITRAKERLYVSCAFSHPGYTTTTRAEPSPFINDLPDKTFEWIHERPRPISHRESWLPSRSSKSQVSPKMFRIGEAVFHKVFGDGIVTNSHLHSTGEEVEVQFKFGVKRLNAEALVKK